MENKLSDKDLYNNNQKYLYLISWGEKWTTTTNSKGEVSLTLTSANLECLWTTSVLFIGVSCCKTLRLFVKARVNLANFVQP